MPIVYTFTFLWLQASCITRLFCLILIHCEWTLFRHKMMKAPNSWCQIRVCRVMMAVLHTILHRKCKWPLHWPRLLHNFRYFESSGLGSERQESREEPKGWEKRLKLHEKSFCIKIHYHHHFHLSSQDDSLRFMKPEKLERKQGNFALWVDVVVLSL